MANYKDVPKEVMSSTMANEKPSSNKLHAMNIENYGENHGVIHNGKLGLKQTKVKSQLKLGN